MFKHFSLVFSFLVSLIFISGCKKGEIPADSPLPNESEVLAQYLEANGDFINTMAPVMISASEVREGQLNNAKQLVFDLRSNCDFHTLGHIEGAVIIQMKDIPWYYRNNDGASMDKVIITCNSGQHASYAAAVLRYYGYSNVYAMTWGMSSWNPKQDAWSAHLSDKHAANFEKTVHDKAPSRSMPEMYTGKTTGEEILAARVKETLIAGFEDAVITSDDVYKNIQDYYIINYAPFESYIAGHMTNAAQYTPNQDLRLSTYLKTLPADKKIAVYCYTGQTSAHVAAYLHILGYKVKTILYGNNGMNYSTMMGKKFNPSDINNFPFIR